MENWIRFIGFFFVVTVANNWCKGWNLDWCSFILVRVWQLLEEWYVCVTSCTILLLKFVEILMGDDAFVHNTHIVFVWINENILLFSFLEYRLSSKTHGKFLKIFE